MRTLPVAAVSLIVLLFCVPAQAKDTPVKSKIVAVDLFKNGLVVVKRETTLAQPGVYVLDDVPSPVHGTYWIESTGPVETLVKMQEVEVPADEAPPGNLQDDLAGKKVTVYFKGANRPPVVGTMMKFKPTKPDETPTTRFLVIQTPKGRTYIDPTEVSAVEAEEAGDKVIRRQPRLLLTLGETDKPETKIAIRYLATGLAWAPSYKIDITDPKVLTLEQHAVIRNELTDLDAAEFRLISGYPSVQYAHVRSLLSPKSTWMSFFAELNSRGEQYADALSNSIIRQQVSLNVRSPHDINLGAIPTGEGVDLHYQPIGKRTLAQGETLAITVAKGKADYERIVEWLVPDTRDDRGRYSGRGESEDDSPWDALKFKNPLPFPMTTGPATVVSNGSFNGQRTSYWVNAGEETVLRVEKALSVRTRAVENELPAKGGDRDFVWIGGSQYRKTTVEGELAVSNHRKETVQLVIRRRFSGELVNAEGAPKSALLTERMFSINRRNELLWTMPLKAGEERKLKYTYTVLVPH
ncbi:MAG: DUF4139 domain-containing protein [Planctomycetia bacterium]|nr:DUF4139 domain-containing protein [Planctomycetia bacterium]